MSHSSKEAWALDDGHCGQGADHISRGFYTNLARAHVLHAAGADCTVSATTDLL
mgnify:CR=1 FL=1